MKVKRQKKVHRILGFFKINFGHRPPYQLLMDGTFTQACLTMKVNIREQMPKYLGDVKLLTTKCCILEAERLGPTLYGATTILKQFSVHKCGHDDDPKPAAKCLKSMIGTENPNRYFIATQDADLREKCRKVPGTPVLYLHHCAPVLEKPSQMSENTANNAVEERMQMNSEQVRLNRLKRQMGLIKEDEGTVKKKRKTGNPNPLSCLKAKKKKIQVNPNQNQGKSQEESNSDARTKRKRKRNRKKKPDSVKETGNKFQSC